MAARDLSPSQVEQLRASVKREWATGKYATRTAMADVGKVYQAQISNLLNDAAVGISHPTAEKIARNLLKKDVRDVIGAPDAPPPPMTELDYARAMAKAGNIPDEAVTAIIKREGIDKRYTRTEWVLLFAGEAMVMVQRMAARSPLGRKPKRTRKKEQGDAVEASPRSKRKVAGNE